MFDLKKWIAKVMAELTVTAEEITSFSSGWTVYTSGQYPKLYKFGSVVVLIGTMKNSSSVTLGSSDTTIFSIPSEYRPERQVNVICQGSGSNRFSANVKANGTVNFSRYSNGTSFSSISAGAWFPFTMAWIVGGGTV